MSMELDLAQAFKAACIAELQAIKPGNVHIFADGHGMLVQDFIKSAEAVAKVIAQSNLTVGERILNSVKVTQQSVNCNTNLGIILLCAVIVQAEVGVVSAEKEVSLQARIKSVLNRLTTQDAELAFRAIALANPAGLGSGEHDVHAAAQVTLLQAMQAAQHRDLIAQQYSNGFADIFDVGLSSYQAAMARWQNPSWSTTFVYLSFLATFPDSHIARKFGESTAKKIQQEAVYHLHAFEQIVNPKTYLRILMAWDADLKQRLINPGTSADLTVATLLLNACNTI